MENEIKKERIQLDMPCVCSPEGQADADALRKRVSEELNIDDEKVFVSAVVASLHWDYDCSVDGVWMDLWYGIAATNKTDRLFVSCDRVEDGLAVLWAYHHDA